jgi:hypothetical protein
MAAVMPGRAAGAATIIPPDPRRQIWERARIPRSISGHLSALRKLTREEWSVPTIMSADRIAATQQSARQQLVSHGTVLFGNWPL